MKHFKSLLLGVFLFLVTGVQMYAPNTHISNERYVLDYKKAIAIRDLNIYKAEFNRFLDALGARESSNNWRIYNKYGYIGEWQLGKAALKEVGYSHIKFKDFIKDPTIFPRKDQVAAVTKLLEINAGRLDDYFYKYIGKTIKGVKITKSGIMAAAHLGGAGGIKLFLDTNGRVDRSDAYGTSLSNYLYTFKDYNI